MQMYFWCICGKEGDLPILLLFPLESPLAISILYWIEGVRVGILVFFSEFTRRLSGFHLWLWCWLWICCKWPLLCWFVLSIPTWITAFIMNGCWILSIFFFFASTEMIMWLLPFLLLTWCITLIAYVEPSLWPWMNQTWSWSNPSFFFFYCWIQFASTCWGFLHLYSSKILAFHFHFS